MVTERLGKGGRQTRLRQTRPQQVTGGGQIRAARHGTQLNDHQPIVNPVPHFRVKTARQHNEVMRIGTLATATGVSVETLRFYERCGLLAPPIRLSSGYREYPDTAVHVVRFVRHAKALGFTLNDITDLLALADGGPDSCDAVRDLATAKIDTVVNKIAGLSAIRDALQVLVASCELPRADRHCPLLVEVDELDDRSTPATI